jgi:hypothetical protein
MRALSQPWFPERNLSGTGKFAAGTRRDFEQSLQDFRDTGFPDPMTLRPERSGAAR